MSKKFKAKRRKSLMPSKLIFHLVIIFMTYIFIKYLYQNYIKDLSKEKVINDIINTKFNTNIDIKDNIIKEYFTINDTIPVINEEQDTPAYDIYIYNTHDTESYSDSFPAIYSIRPNIKTASYILEEQLEKYNLKTYIEKESINKVLKENNWSYKYSYEASRSIIKKNIENNNYKLIIDLHRDSGSRSKTTLNYNNNSYAKVLFVIGKEYNSYEENYQIAKKLNEYLNNEIEGLSRGVILKSGDGVNGIYNQDLNKNIILIELGGEENEIDELSNTIEILAKCIDRYIGEL